MLVECGQLASGCIARALPVHGHAQTGPVIHMCICSLPFLPSPPSGESARSTAVTHSSFPFPSSLPSFIRRVEHGDWVPVTGQD